MLGLLVILSLSLSLSLRLSLSLSSLVIADVLLFPMMYNMWGLTWFWDDLKTLYWKCWSDDGQSINQSDKQTDRISTCRLDPSVRKGRGKMSGSVLKLKSVLKVRFYFPACLFESEFRAQLIWPPKMPFQNHKCPKNICMNPHFQLVNFSQQGNIIISIFLSSKNTFHNG